jgi:hypothetical protein
MPIFGQVWLWSLAAFLLGALLCWVLVVLPVRRRISTLESRLASLRADAKLSAAAERSRAAEPAGGNPVPGFGDPRDEIRPESLTRAYSLTGVQDAPRSPYGGPAEDPADRGALQLTPPPDVEPRPYVAPVEDGPTSGPSGRDWFDEQPAEEPAGQSTGAHRLIDDDEDDRGTVFTQRTTPIPAALIRSLDDAQPEPPKPDDSLVDDLADEGTEEEPPPPAVAPLTPPILVTPPEDMIPGGLPSRGADRPPVFEPTMVVKNGTSQKSTVDTSAEPAPAPNNRSTIAELPSRTELVEPKVSGGISIEPERTQSALPKRIPAKPRHQYHPFGVETVTPAVSPTTTTSSGDRTRSLFEPVIPAEGGQTEVPPPPHRLHSAPISSGSSVSGGSSSGSRPSAPGPFGPGSAMPLPGGASPSPEFTVKASVTALRYCTPESPQFGRTIAEVWFRTAADAERVGFRPVG